MRSSLLHIFCWILLVSFTGCSENEGNPSPFTASTVGNREISEIKIALITSGLERGNMFQQQAYNAMIDMIEFYGFHGSVYDVEGDLEENWLELGETLCEEGYELILGVGWQSADPFSSLKIKFPHIDFVAIDAVSKNTEVKSITFEMAEGAYILGVLYAIAFPEESTFGFIGNYDNSNNASYRYGFLKGLQKVNPLLDLQCVYTNSYDEPEIAYEKSKELMAEGISVIMGAVSSVGNEGIFQAVLEESLSGNLCYGSGVSVDQTSEENPYIISGLTKNTGLAVEIVLHDYISGSFSPEHLCLGLTENGSGVVSVTTSQEHYRNWDILTEEVLEEAREAYRQVIHGDEDLNLRG